MLYVGRTYKNGGDVNRIIDTLTPATILITADPPVAAAIIADDPLAVPLIESVLEVSANTTVETRIWERTIDNYVRR